MFMSWSSVSFFNSAGDLSSRFVSAVALAGCAGARIAKTRAKTKGKGPVSLQSQPLLHEMHFINSSTKPQCAPTAQTSAQTLPAAQIKRLEPGICAINQTLLCWVNADQIRDRRRRARQSGGVASADRGSRGAHM